MKHVFKAGGEYKTEDGFSYSVKCVNSGEVSGCVKDGWCKSLEELETAPCKSSQKKSNAK